jgi:hypothetical protein
MSNPCKASQAADIDLLLSYVEIASTRYTDGSTRKKSLRDALDRACGERLIVSRSQ